MIQLRYKPLKSGKYSLYLDIYSNDKSGNQRREYEFLKLYVSKDYSKIKNIASEDKDSMQKAEYILKARSLEVSGEINGLKVRQKGSGESLTGYLDALYNRYGDRHVLTLINTIKEYVGKKDILFSAITPSWLDDFKEHLLRNVSQNTANGYLSLLRAKVIQAEEVDKGVFTKFKMPQMQETTPTTLEAWEVEALARTPYPQHPHLRLAFLFSCFTGLRKSDIYNLLWSEISHDRGKSGAECYYMNLKPLKTQKTTGKILKVPLTSAAIAILEELKKEGVKSGKVFDRLPSDRNACTLLKIWAAKAGIKKNVHFHAGRHSFATIGLTYGIDIYSVSKLLGHSNVRTTERYAKMVDEKKRVEVKKLPTLSK